MKKILVALGIIFLISNIVLAFFIVKNYGWLIQGGYYGSEEKIFNPVAWYVAFAVLFNGIIIFAFSMGMAEIIEKNDNILYKLSNMQEKKEILSSTKYKKCPDCGHLNSTYSSGCSKCEASLADAQIVEK